MNGDFSRPRRVLPRVAALVAAQLCGCADDPAPAATRGRSDAVSAAPGAESAGRAAPKPSASAPKKPRELCARPPSSAGRELAEVQPSVLGASGEPALPELGVGGSWTWINLWASWCGPCKEEMPMLLGYAKEAKIRLAFLSLDDDERLAKRFLDQQPQGGVRATYHFGPGEARDKWLAAVGIGEISKLPVHVWADPNTKPRCSISGALAPDSLPKIGAFMQR